MEKVARNGFFRFEDLVLHSQAALVLLIEILAGLVSSFSLAFLFIHLSSDIFDKDILFYDRVISGLIYDLRSPLLTSLMLFLTNFGGEYILGVLAVAVVIATWFKHKKESVLFIIIFGMGIVLNSGLKLLIQRPRPIMSPLIAEISYSYPSAHAMNSFIFYGTLAYFFYHFTRKRRLSFLLTFLAFLLIGLIGFSRVYLGVHYPSDVLAGYIVGFWWFIFVLLYEKTLALFRLFKESERP